MENRAIKYKSGSHAAALQKESQYYLAPTVAHSYIRVKDNFGRRIIVEENSSDNFP